MPPLAPQHPRRRARSGALRKLATALLVLTLFTTAIAQVCQAELTAALDRSQPPQQMATSLVRTAVEALEPALPRRRSAPAALSDPNARWLYERGFLPAGWDDGEPLTAEAWARLLGELQEPYRVRHRNLSGAIDPDTLLTETGSVLEAVAQATRPLALIATSRADRSKVELAGVTWNWTPWPRFLLFDPSNLPNGEDTGIDEILASMGTCAWRPSAYLSTNSETATNYYLGNARAQTRLLATNASSESAVIPKELEEAVLTFRADMLVGSTVAAIGFEGPGPSIGQVTNLLFSSKTNVGAFDLLYYLALP